MLPLARSTATKLQKGKEKRAPPEGDAQYNHTTKHNQTREEQIEETPQKPQ
jgi:hypothetical protein